MHIFVGRKGNTRPGRGLYSLMQNFMTNHFSDQWDQFPVTQFVLGISVR